MIFHVSDFLNNNNNDNRKKGRMRGWCKRNLGQNERRSVKVSRVYFLFSLCHFSRCHWYISLQHLHDLYILYIFFRYYPISFSTAAATVTSSSISEPLSFVYLVSFCSTFECFKKTHCTEVCCYEKPYPLSP